MSACAMHGVRPIATIRAPCEVAHVLHQFDPASLGEIEAKGKDEVLVAAVPRCVQELR
jgi:uncharacterized protein